MKIVRGKIQILRPVPVLEDPSCSELILCEVDISGELIRNHLFDIAAWDHAGFQVELSQREVWQAEAILLRLP